MDSLFQCYTVVDCQLFSIFCQVIFQISQPIFSILIASHHSGMASILKGYIKIDYLIKSHVHWEFFVEVLFKHYSDN